MLISFVGTRSFDRFSGPEARSYPLWLNGRVSGLERIESLDKFLVQQKFAPLVNIYRVSTVGSDGESEGEPLLHVRQKRMKIREEIEIFGDEDRKNLVLRIKSKKVFEFRGRSEVQLPDGTVIGQLQKVFGRSMFRSTWEVLDASGAVVATAQESSMPIAILRRVWGFIPFANEIPCPIPFDFTIEAGGREIGSYKRLWSLRDKYLMAFEPGTGDLLDRRVAVAFAIALDSLQDR